MSEWRAANPQGGIDLGDDMLRLLDLRFADDVLMFAHEGRGTKFIGQRSATSRC